MSARPNPSAARLLRGAVALSLFASFTAHAQVPTGLSVDEPPSRAELAEARRQRYADEGARALEAFERDHEASRLAEAADAYDLAEQPTVALSLWRRYRTLDAPTSEQRAYAEERIASLATRLARFAAPNPPPPLVDTPTIVVPEERPAEPPPWPAIGLTAAGGLVAVIGSVFLVSAAQRDAALEEGANRDRVNQSYAIGGALLGVGVTSAAIGAIWWLWE